LSTCSRGADRPRGVLPAAALFLLAAASAIFFTFSYPLPEVRSDAAGYLALARNVAAGAGFTYDGTTPMVYRPPLFSVLLGGWFFLTGSSSPLSAALFQSLVHALGVLAAFLLFLEVTSSRIWAIGSALFLAVNPLLVTRVAFVLQEPTILLVTTLAVLLSVRLIKAPSPGRAGLAGAAWGLATLAKAVAWFAPFLLLGMRFLPGGRRFSWRGREAAALLVCFAAVIAPWTIRNYLHFGRFIPVNDQGQGMLEWNVAHASPPGAVPGERLVAELREGRAPREERRAALWGYVLDHPRYFLVDRVVRNAFHFAGPARDWWIARGLVQPGEARTAFWILSLLFHVPLYLFLLFRTLQWWREAAAPSLGFPILFYWAYWIEHAIVWGDPRFGLAVYPLLVGMIIPVLGEGRPPGLWEAEGTNGPAA
jgi:4-amino-4-deoxy-L-arabinose transferase-like glycosyltransferase